MILLLTGVVGAQASDGPATIDLSGVATLRLPAGYRFHDRASTAEMLRAWGNYAEGSELGCVVTISAIDNFTCVVSFDPVGYIPEAELRHLDGDQLLECLRFGTRAANQMRQQQKLEVVEFEGWLEPPRYDPERHQVNWTIGGRVGQRAVANLNSRLLLRHGYLSFNLLCAEADVATFAKEMQALLDGVKVLEGQAHADHQSSDQVCRTGLLALVAGVAGEQPDGFFRRSGKILLSLIVAWKKFLLIALIIGIAGAAGIKKR